MSIRTIQLLSLLLLLASNAFAQPAPAIQWQTTLGGAGLDQAYGILATPDGGCVFTGWSSSADGDFKDHHGTTATRDCILGRLDANGKVVWKKSLGGTSNDGLGCIINAHGGGYMLCGGTNSTDGDVSGHHGTTSNSDCWVVKIDTIGNILWQKCYGGSLDEDALRIVATDDGGYLFAARCFSNDGDVTVHHGSATTSDYWVVKIDSVGKLLWEKSYGGSGYDAPFALAKTDDNAFVIAGDGSSNDGDASGNHGGSDIWTIKIDDTGKLLWQHPFGGPGNEDMNSITLATDGSYIFGGSVDESGGDITMPHHGHTDSYDIWIVKVSRDGKIIWDKSFGGTGHDYEQDVRATPDGGCLVTGYTTSIDGDVSGHHGDTTQGTGYDGWVFKLDSNGTLEWQKSIGGTKMDGATGIALTPDGGAVLACNTQSSDGDVAVNHGGEDAWIVKLAPFMTTELTRDVGVDRILSPGVPNPMLWSTDSVPVVVRFKNFGQTNDTDTKVFAMLFNTKGDLLYQDSSIVHVWKSGDSITITFQPFITPAPGEYFFSANTNLVADSHSSNDKVTIRIVITSASVDASSGYAFVLESNNPNPFTSSTTLTYTLPENGHVSLRILDMTGSVVRQEFNDNAEAAGPHSVTIDLHGEPNGVYVSELTFLDPRGAAGTLTKKLTHMSN